MNKIRSILIQGPSWLGDMIMAQSLFRLLRAKDPEVSIDVLAPDWSRGVLERMPEVRQSHRLPLAHGEFGLAKRWRLARRLRDFAYDEAIVLTNNWKSALIPFFAGIPKRTGWLGEMRWGLLNDIRYLSKPDYPLMVQRYIALGLPARAALPSNILYPKLQTDALHLELCVQKFKLTLDKPVLALCPGAAFGPAKRWPAHYFSEVANNYLSRGWQIWFFGSKQDAPVIDGIRQNLSNNTQSFAGILNLLETIDLMSVARAVVANDSGLLHTAASLDLPLVAIYGSTTPKFSPPLGDKVVVLKKELACSPCFARECKFQHLNCMNMIKPREVLDSIDSLGDSNESTAA